MSAQEQFRLLYVCVGNVCRSVLAERMTRRELERNAPFAGLFRVGSAGTRCRGSRPMHPYTARLLADRTADTSGFAARRLTAELVRHTDLVLTATVRERDDVLGLLPAAIRRTFTIKEFARLVARAADAGDYRPADPVERARQIVVDALRWRGRVPYRVDGDPLPDDIPDPDRTVEAFQACAATVDRAVQAIVPALCGPARAPGGAAVDRDA
ncbi:low molecular weight phosphatase family protein [Dactylosporangium sp. CA-092794]|uniref:arsenate-mycothiol transferase ArsC n=1 Tax=Dactylosporangium sp. CA-092794 TaxID=3239929 RepID=UPI003D934F02